MGDLPYEMIREPVKEDADAYVRSTPTYKLFKEGPDYTLPNNSWSEAMRLPEWQVEEMINNFSTGGLIKWGPHTLPHHYILRGMGDVSRELPWWDKVYDYAHMIKNPTYFAGSAIGPKQPGRAHPEGFVLHGDAYEWPALGVADLYSGDRASLDKMFASPYTDTIKHLLKREGMLRGEPRADILREIADSVGSVGVLPNKGELVGELRQAAKTKDYGWFDDRLGRVDEPFRFLFNTVDSTKGGTAYQRSPDLTEQFLDATAKYEGPFNVWSPEISKIEKAYDAQRRLRSLEEQSLPQDLRDIRSRYFSSAGEPRFLRDPHTTTPSEFFKQQGELYASGANYPTGKFNELYFPVDKNLRENLVGVMVDKDNPSDELLDFARRRGLQVFNAPYYATSVGKIKTWADLDAALDNPKTSGLVQEALDWLSPETRGQGVGGIREYYKHKFEGSDVHRNSMLPGDFLSGLARVLTPVRREAFTEMMTAPRTSRALTWGTFSDLDDKTLQEIIDRSDPEISINWLREQSGRYGIPDHAMPVGLEGPTREVLGMPPRKTWDPLAGAWTEGGIIDKIDTNAEKRKRLSSILSKRHNFGEHEDPLDILMTLMSDEKKAKKVFPEKIKDIRALESDQVPNNYNYRYSGNAFTWD
jgi:hypothetical protein